MAFHYGQPVPAVARWIGWPVVLAVAAAAALGSLGPAVAGLYTVAAGLAAAVYAVIGLAALAGGPSWTHPWLLRQPATAALGSLILVTLPPRWWLSGAVAPGVAMSAAAAAYLVVELRNHRVSPGAAVRRAVALTAAGLLHAFLVSLLFLRWAAPWFTQGSDHPAASLDGWWVAAHSTVPSVASMLWLATTWCFTAGVFTQVLWDDKPLTAALGHIEWTRR